VFLLCGCALFYNGRESFIGDRDYDVGRNVDHVYATPSEILPCNETQDKYIYESNNGKCKWAYYVDKETKIIEKWEYMSSPNECSVGVDWFGGNPW
jgi:hypothetical protein